MPSRYFFKFFHLLIILILLIIISGDYVKNLIRAADTVIALVLTVIYAFVIYGSAALPDEIIVHDDKTQTINHFYSVSVDNNARSVDYQSAESVGGSESDLKFLNVIPVKTETVSKEEREKVLVSGKSFGIKLYTDGVIIVGTKDVNVGGDIVNPAKSAGLQVGDVIISINGTRVYSSDEVEKILNDNNGQKYTIRIKRSGAYKTFELEPVYVPNESCYKAGMWVRDSTAGIGTVTFFYPNTNMVGALGHPITDVDTGEIMPILNGEAVETTVTSVTKSTGSETGSLCCDFSSVRIGALTKNTNYGVYGNYDSSVDLSETLAYEVASVQEIQKGFCQLICTVEGETPAVYSAEITKISYNDKDKNMIIRVTDSDLLKKTGGIVQGMSGTPIIQNGKLIGAVTHVMVNSPSKGYAIFAQTMLDECK